MVCVRRRARRDHRPVSGVRQEGRAASALSPEPPPDPSLCRPDPLGEVEDSPGSAKAGGGC